MGLCKCRTVTNLFCFQHRKNVCEKCIVSDHERCIVRSYLQWLQDSDFDSTCPLCREDLTGSDRPLVRLSCLDLFHLDCINNMCDQLPENTSKAGYACPTCNTPILPPVNAASQISQNLRTIFEGTQWAKRLMSMKAPIQPQQPTQPALEKIRQSNPPSTVSLGSPVEPMLKPISSDLQINMPASTSSRVQLDFEDPDEAKYERRQNPMMTGYGTLHSMARSALAAPARLRRRLSKQTVIAIVVFSCFLLILAIGNMMGEDETVV